MTVRKATLEDLPVVLELAHEFFVSSQYAEYEAKPERLEELFTFVLDKGIVLLAEDQAGVAGFLVLVPVPNLFTGELYAEELAWFVRPRARGSRAALRLMDAGALWCRQSSLASWRMVAPTDSPTVASYYRRLGFSEVETTFIKRFAWPAGAPSPKSP